MDTRSSGGARGALVAGIVGMAVLGVAALGVWAATNERRESDARALEGHATDLSLAFQRRVEDAVRLTGRAAVRSVEWNDPAIVNGMQVDVSPGGTLAYIERSGRRLEVVAGDLGGSSAESNPQLVRAVDAAGASGTTVVADAVRIGRRTLVPIIRAVFRGAEQRLSSEPGPAEGFDARPVVAGYAVSLIDPELVLGAEVPPGLGARLFDGTGALAAAGAAAAGPSAESRLPISSDQRWTLVVHGGMAAPPLAWPAWPLAVTGVCVALLATAVVARERARRARADRSVDASERRLRTITEVSSVVQQSLAVADVLPAAAVRLRDDLDLAGVSITVGDARETVDAFAIGAPTDPGVSARLDVPEGLAGGATLALALQRAGRNAGTLRVVSATPLRAENLATLAAVADLVTAALANARLFEAQEAAVMRLRELDDMKNVFLGTASHELVTPTTALAGFAQLLERHWDQLPEERKREFVARIAANALSLDVLVRDLLDFSRLERGRRDAIVERIDLSALVEDSVARIRTVFAEHRFGIDVAPDLWVDGDLDAIRRIMTNLASNAAKFSPPGSTITLTAEPVGSRIMLVVDDEGPGVPPAERSRIFDRFYRGSGDTVLKTRGAGIGLAVVRELAEQMGAVVRAGEAPGGGARFTVEFASAVPSEGTSARDAKEPLDAQHA